MAEVKAVAQRFRYNFSAGWCYTDAAITETVKSHDGFTNENLYDQSAIDTLTAERDAARAECERLRTLCRDMLPVFEAARPLVLNLERLRDATKGVG